MKKSIILFVSVSLAVFILFSISFYFFFPGQVLTIFRNIQQKQGQLVKKKISIDKHKVYYYDNELATNNIVVMLHGLMANKDHFIQVAAYFKKKIRIIIPDLPGHGGESTKILGHDYSLPNQVKYLQQFLDNLKLSNVHLVANSFGGFLSVRYLLKYPKRVASLVLINSAGILKAKNSLVTKTFLKTGKNLMAVNTLADYKRLMDIAFVKKPYVPSHILAYIAAKVIARKEYNNQMFKVFINSKKYKLDNILNKVKVPSLIIWGKEDKIIDVSAAYLFHKGIKNSEIKILSGVGHAPMMSFPEKTADTIKEFYRKNKIL